MKALNGLFLLRLCMGFLFFWAFIDKVFGLGFSTPATKSWLAGVSPTTGFLKFGTTDAFSYLFHSLAGNVLIDWLFMLGLLFIGVAFLFNISLRLASYIGILMMFLIYLSVFPPKNNPILDEHIIYIAVFLAFLVINTDDQVGLQKWWKKTAIVKKITLFK